MKQLIKFFLFLFVSIFLFSACIVEPTEEYDDTSNTSSSSSSTSSTTSSSSSSSTSSSDSGDADSSTNTDSSDSTVTTSASGLENSGDCTIYINLSSLQVSEDNSNWYEISSDEVLLCSSTVEVSLANSEVIKIDLTAVEQSTSVALTGSLTSGGVKIQTSTDYETGLYLDNVSITSSNYPCIDLTKGGAVSVFLTGTNTLVDGRKYGYGYGSDYESTSVNYVEKGSDSKGSLYCKGGLRISETSEGGSLSVTQAYKNCIASKDGILEIAGGTITLKNYNSSSDTGKNGLFGGQGIIVSGGSIKFDGKGIISSSDLRKANAFKTDDEDYPSSYVKITGGTTNVTTYNGKGINAPSIVISGGNNTFTVTGTTSYSESSKSGSWYDADGVKETGTVSYSPEGIEAASSITISGGKTIISAPDDGVNASNTGASLTISGGFLYVSSKGDGLDCNGNIKISGGLTVVSQTGDGNSPIDCGDNSYSFTVTGGTVFAMGGSGMFSESIPSSTSNAMIYSTSLNGSTSLSVNDSDGHNLIAVENPLSYGAAIFISSQLSSGSTYYFVRGASLSGNEYVDGSGVYYPASSASGGSSSSVTAGTSTSASSTASGPSSRGGPNRW